MQSTGRVSIRHYRRVPRPYQLGRLLDFPEGIAILVERRTKTGTEGELPFPGDGTIAGGWHAS